MGKKDEFNKRQGGISQSGRKRWTLFYGYKDDVQGWELRMDFDHKPELAEIKSIIISHINQKTDEKILSGMVWNGMPIWLSQENQINYKVFHDQAIFTQGASLPIKFKFGTDNNPVYYEFTTLMVLKDFYSKVLEWIQQSVGEGWAEKDGIDFNVYDVK